MIDLSKYVKVLFRAFCEKISYFFSFVKRSSAYFAIRSTSPISAIKPHSLCFTNSGKPPTLELITGNPQDIASKAAKPKLSD
jgi:hypothetical protein